MYRAGVELIFWGVDQPFEPLEATVTVGGAWKLGRQRESDAAPWRGLDDSGCLALTEFVCQNRFVKVVDVQVSAAADLTLLFADGHRLTAGASDECESWEVDGGPYKVASTPGRDVAVWTNLDHRSQ